MRAGQDDNGKSHLQLVREADAATRSRLDREAEHRRQQAAEEKLHRPLKKLAANTLRIVPGAGRPEELLYDCIDVIKAAEEYIDSFKRGVNAQLIKDALELKISRGERSADVEWS